MDELEDIGFVWEQQEGFWLPIPVFVSGGCAAILIDLADVGDGTARVDYVTCVPIARIAFQSGWGLADVELDGGRAARRDGGLFQLAEFGHCEALPFHQIRRACRAVAAQILGNATVDAQASWNTGVSTDAATLDGGDGRTATYVGAVLCRARAVIDHGVEPPLHQGDGVIIARGRVGASIAVGGCEPCGSPNAGATRQDVGRTSAIAGTVDGGACPIFCLCQRVEVARCFVRTAKYDIGRTHRGLKQQVETGAACVGEESVSSRVVVSAASSLSVALEEFKRVLLSFLHADSGQVELGI